MVGFNMAGIFCVVVYSVFLKKKMFEMQNQLDKDNCTPSDYALLVRNIPLSMVKAKDGLK